MSENYVFKGDLDISTTFQENCPALNEKLGHSPVHLLEERIANLNQSGQVCGILDFGCGANSALRSVARTAANVKCVGTSLQDMRTNEQKVEDQSLGGKLELKILHAIMLNTIEQRFHFIFSFNTLHHLSDPVDAICKLSGLAAPGAVMVLGLGIRDSILKIKLKDTNFEEVLKSWETKHGISYAHVDTEREESVAIFFPNDWNLTLDAPGGNVPRIDDGGTPHPIIGNIISPGSL